MRSALLHSRVGFTTRRILSRVGGTNVCAVGAPLGAPTISAKSRLRRCCHPLDAWRSLARLDVLSSVMRRWPSSARASHRAIEPGRKATSGPLALLLLKTLKSNTILEMDEMAGCPSGSVVGARALTQPASQTSLAFLHLNAPTRVNRRRPNGQPPSEGGP
jgi:hypothetical protein